ncbi:O-methylsterigmatocystin oxidoreductase, partial [Leucoagaricus sp. SymC.cos]
SKSYSEILNINICRANIVILRVFDRRSAIYSSRPQFPMVCDLMRRSFLFSTMPYNEDWYRRRRLFRASEFQPRQRAYVRRLLPQLIQPEGDFSQALRLFPGGIAITLAYGIDVKSENDPYINISERAISLLNHASAPGKYTVDAIPWLKYVPDWFPGAHFKRDAKQWKKAALQFIEAPFQATKRDLEEGIAPLSYSAICLESINASTEEERQVQEEDVKDIAVIFFGGGTDTTMAVFLTFMFAMTCHLLVQLRAQEELDRVVGPDRLPDFLDAPSLPYMNALIREVMRWRPTSPVAIPHGTSEDDICDGYFIPKGSVVIPNVWAILQDPETYPNPTHFDPERFLTPSGALNNEIMNPADAIFGFGRRACPGAHMAQSTLYIVAASILHTMSISWPSDAKGEASDVKYTDNLFPTPEPFPCAIKPRSKQAEELIKNEALSTY